MDETPPIDFSKNFLQLQQPPRRHRSPGSPPARHLHKASSHLTLSQLHSNPNLQLSRASDNLICTPVPAGLIRFRTLFHWFSLTAAMALCGRLARRVPGLARQCRLSTPSPSSRTFTSRISASSLTLKATNEQQPAYRQLRNFSRIAALRNKTQEAPNAQAYLNSGVISGARDLVDVKKVLVIGSGGLSIGQAGEFDYSGKSSGPTEFASSN